MQGIAGILGGKGGGAGSGAPAGAAAEPPGRAQPVRAVPAGKGPPAGVGGRRAGAWGWFVRGVGLCVGRSPGGGAAAAAAGRRAARRAAGCAPAEGAGGQAWAGRAVKPPGGGCRGRRARRAAPAEGRGVGGGRRPPPKAARRAACPAGRGAGVCGERDGKAYHAPDSRQPGLYKKLYTISLNCHLFLPKIKKCVKYCSQFADIMDASERDGVPKKGRSEP